MSNLMSPVGDLVGFINDLLVSFANNLPVGFAHDLLVGFADDLQSMSSIANYLREDMASIWPRIQLAKREFYS